LVVVIMVEFNVVQLYRSTGAKRDGPENGL
jgi:hypothetical protein